MANSKQYIPENNSYGMNHEYVDLGLSVKWATCNLGAYLPEEPGDYFAFGEIKAGKIDREVYQSPPVDNIAGSEYDMARANWGEPWRLPSKEEFQELIDRCEWTWISKEACSGYLVTSKVNGNSIFLPAAGYKWWDWFPELESEEDFTPWLEEFCTTGNYWSSTKSSPGWGLDRAIALYFDASEIYNDHADSFRGFSVRPVRNQLKKNVNDGLKRMKYECIYGFIDNDGNEILYDDVCDMSEGMIAVKLNGKWGYINETGKLIIPFVYDEAGYFSDGLAAVAIGIAWGLIDKAGNDVIPIQYDYISLYATNGLYFAARNDEDFIIDKTGRELIRKINYGEDLDLFPKFHEGMASVQYNDQYGFLNDKGDEIIPFKYDDAVNFNEGLAPVKLNAKWGFIDKADNVVIPFKYDDASSFNEGLAPVKLNAKWGFIDKADNVVIPFKYDNARSFNEGLAPVKLNTKWGFIDKADNVVIPFKYDDAYEFNKKGLAVVRLNEKLWNIDRQGNLSEWRI